MSLLLPSFTPSVIDKFNFAFFLKDIFDLANHLQHCLQDFLILLPNLKLDDINEDL